MPGSRRFMLTPNSLRGRFALKHRIWRAAIAEKTGLNSPSAEQHDATRQGPDPGSEQLLDLGHEVLEPVEPKCAVDGPAPQILVGNDDLARSIAVDLVHHTGEWFVAKNQQSSLPCRDLRGIDRHRRLNSAA